jgi:hypothetical protein
MAAAYTLAANDNLAMFKFLLTALTDPEITPAEHLMALNHLQRLTGVKTPVTYLNSGAMKAQFLKRYKQLVRERKAARKRAGQK